MNPKLAPDTGLRLGLRYLVGVSGGRDSVVLLHWLLASGFRKLTVCHLNHGLRGRDSGADAAFVRRLAQHHDLGCEIEKTDVAKLAGERGLSLEAAGRAARHEFFADIVHRHRCRRVFLGHHADDQVETILINLFRGSGTLSGMRPHTEITVAGRGIELLRPLLGATRDEIDAYAKHHCIAHREDASNAGSQFLRNRVRHELLPGLREIFHRDVSKTVTRAFTVAAAEQALLDNLLPAPPDTVKLPLRALREMEIPLQRRLLHRWLRARCVPDVGFAEVERVRSLIADNLLAKVNLPGGHHARRRRGVLFIQPPNTPK